MDRTEYSPDGRYRVDYWQDEVRMGWWISAPTIVDQHSGATLFRMAGDVDAQVEWQFGLVAIRAVHTYTRDKFTVWLDPAAELAWLESAPETKVPLAQASEMAAAYVAPLDSRARQQNRIAQERARRESEEWERKRAVAEQAPVEEQAPPDLPEPEPEPQPYYDSDSVPQPEIGAPAQPDRGVAAIVLLVCLFLLVAIAPMLFFL